jgi:hypothetical protein
MESTLLAIEQAFQKWQITTDGSLPTALDQLRSAVKKMDDRIKCLPELCQETSRDAEVLQLLSRDVSQMTTDIKSFINKMITEQRKTTFLESLYFDGMLDRQEAIAVSHDKTSEWVLKESQPWKAHQATSSDWIFETSTPYGAHVTFSRWLESQGGLYWIRGKAGSGKSTIMKFIIENKQTTQILRVWAGDRPLVVTQHFFWASGSKLQRSQEGLFRSLLFNIFQQCQDMIPRALQAIPNFHGVTHTWRHEELMAILRSLPTSGSSMSFCFFIDGLDEYDGDHDQLITILQELSTVPDVKFCVSSRPWVKFIDQFGGDLDRVLKLEDFTQSDIRVFVNDMFRSHRAFQRHANDLRYLELVEEVVRRANGVFLWVYLVCRSLLDGMAYSDRIVDLHRRLAYVQPDLELFFKQIILSADPVYQKQTARSFLVALYSHIPLPLIMYLILDLLEEHPEAIIVEPLLLNRAKTRAEDMVRRLDGRTKGLLEVRHATSHEPNFDSRVEFLHGSVRSFFQTPDMQHSLQELAGPDFIPGIVLCEAMTIALQSFMKPGRVSGDIMGSGFDFLHELMVHARRVERDLNRTPACLERLERCAHVGVCNLLTKGVTEGVNLYLVGALSRNPGVLYAHGSSSRPLLDVALTETRPSFATLQSLLQHGADPNEVYGYTTVWGYFLDYLIMEGVEIGDAYEYAELKAVVGLLISSGAHLDFRVNSGLSAKGAIEALFGWGDAQYIFSMGRHSVPY